jgi:thymidylate kinase
MTHSPAESSAALMGSRLHPRLQQLFTAWERGGITWCVLRMPRDTYVPDSDVDLLIDPSNLVPAARIAEDHRFVRRPGLHRGVHLITYDSATGTWLWLHCVAALSFGPNQFLLGDAAGSLLRRQAFPFPPRLSTHDEFWVTLAHCLLDRRRVTPKHRERLSILAHHSTPDGVIAHGLNTMLPQGVSSKALLQACRLEDWDALERLIPDLVAEAAHQTRSGLFQRAIRFARALLSRFTGANLSRGVSVALLGPDGAGKSTLAAGIERTFVFPVRLMYMGLTGGMLRQVDRLRVPGVVHLGRLVVLWARYLVGQYHLRQGRLVVFDRYIYDADVPTPRPLSLPDRVGRWVEGRCCPAPDLILVLDAPGEVMHQRKPSYTPEMIENWRQHFLALSRRLPQLEVIDTTRSSDEVRSQATALIWQVYVRRWRRSMR